MSEPLHNNDHQIRALFEQGERDAALSAFSRWLESHPTQSDCAQMLLFLVDESNQGDVSQAIGRLLEELSHHIPPQIEIALDDKMQDVLGDLRRGITMNANNTLNRTSALLPLADRYPELHLLYGRAILLQSDSPRRDMGSRFGGRDDDDAPSFASSHKTLKDARVAFERVLELVPPDDEEIHHAAVPYLADVCKRLYDYGAALKWYALATTHDPSHHETWIATGKDVLDAVTHWMDKTLRDEVSAETPLFVAVDGHRVLCKRNEILLRCADWRLLIGQMDKAEKQYRSVLANLSEEAPELSPRALGQLETLCYAFPNQLNKAPERASASPSPSGGGLPFLRRLGVSNTQNPPKPEKAEPPSPLPVDKYGFPISNPRLYAIAGLIECADRRGDSGAVLHLIYELLEDRDLPAASNSTLIDRLEALEADYARQNYAMLRADAAIFRESKRWSQARNAYLELVNSPHAQADDFLWLTRCMVATGERPENIAQVLHRVSPHDILSIAKPDARAVLDALADAGLWELTDRYAAHLQSAKKWWENYLIRRASYQAQGQAEAAHLLSIGRVEQAEIVLSDLLDIDPQDAAAQLGMGRVKVAERSWSSARRLLTPLLNHPEQGIEAARLLTEVDIAEGYLNRAEDRLHALDDVTAAEGIRRRMDQMPYILLRDADSTIAPDTLARKPAETLVNAFFAVRLAGVHLAATLPSIQHQTAEFLIGLHRVDQFLAQPHFVWRYIGREGRLTIALICRVEAHDAKVAESTAQTLWHIIRHLLPLQDAQIYTYEPVIHADELAYLLAPMPIQSAAQIVRAEAATGLNVNNLYRVQSFGLYIGNMHRLLKMVAEHPGGAVAETYFQPTDIYAWERHAIEAMLSRENDNAAPDYVRGDGVMVQLERSAGYQMAAQVYQDLVGTMQTLPFIVQTRVGAPGHLNPALPELVGLELFGPSSFRVQMAYTQDEVEAARRTITEVSAERWGYTSAPPGLERWRYLLTPAEMLTATRLPLPTVEGLPGIPTLKVRVAPLPARLPETGVLLGESIVALRGKPAQINLLHQDRLRHIYVVGRTGTGKSTLLQNMALQDIEEGRGVGIIDPHGDLVENVLARIPAHRRHDVILFDPSDIERPVGLNILDVQGAYAQNVVISDFIGLLYVLFDPNRIGMIGPRFENAVRNSMLLGMDVAGSTFIEVVRIMTDKAFRDKALALATDPIVKSYWTDVASNISRMGDGDMLDYVTSKFGRFINDRLMRNIIGQSQNALDLKGIMNEGKILLVNLAKGKIGPESSHFLGLILMPQIFVAALSRARLSEDQRRMFCLYVDEFHNFTTPTFSTMLAEARKYGVALTVANQFISQLTPSIREAVFGNIGTLMSFRVGVKDAQFLAQEYYPVYGENDLINLPNYYALAKMLIDGDSVPPFPVRTLPDNRLREESAAEGIRRHSQMRFGRDERVVNMEIRQRYENPPRRREK